jgi:hypothetical protein
MSAQKRLLLLLTVALFAFTLVTPSLSGQSVTAAPPVASGAWFGDYFANRTLSGSPTLSRYDDAINFNWGDGSPGDGLPADDFSVRWTRDEWFVGGTFRFTVLADDGVRLWVGDQMVVDEWHDHQAEPLYVDRYIPAGTHQVRVEYYEHGGGAIISIGWRRVEGGAAWRGEYFDNRKLEGNPTLVRDDRAVDFDWGYGSPDPDIPADDFSVRWTRRLGFTAGTYRFFTSTDDGVRVWVDATQVINAWTNQKLPNTHSGDIYIPAGQHTITIEFYERGGEASAHAWWRLQETFTGFHGEYFDNRHLIGGPALERDDAEIDFDWGAGPPVAWMPDDNFSIRWTRTVHFAPDQYRFVVWADDGVRLWLDENLIIDQWQDMDYELHYVSHYLEGPHSLRLEYYEHTGGARVRFWWEKGVGGEAPPPSAATTPVDAPGPAPEAGTGETWPDDPWEASYFAGVDLSGRPLLTRVETTLDHNWGWGSPGAGVPSDYFSARWTQPLSFQGGLYRFTTTTDDGVRLWVDGQLLIDSWRPMRGTRSATIRLSPGTHDVKMEYYERNGVALARLTWRRISR